MPFDLSVTTTASLELPGLAVKRQMGIREPHNAVPTTIDVLLISHARPQYTRLSLGNLVQIADPEVRIWIWHNGMHAETLRVVESFRDHPRVHRFHHSPENRKLREPTNWLWSEAKGDLFAKIDDDTLVPREWPVRMREAHAAEPCFGALTCWHHAQEDLDERLYRKKLRTYGGISIMQNCWVNGSGYTVKREAIKEAGLLAEGQSWTHYCVEMALRGWIHGWLYPFLLEDHMDDPRSPHCGIRTDAELGMQTPLSAQINRVETVQEWLAQQRRSARMVQKAPLDPRRFRGWRRRFWGPELQRLLTAVFLGRRRSF